MSDTYQNMSTKVDTFYSATTGCFLLDKTN